MAIVSGVTSTRSAGPTTRRPLARSLLLAAVFVAPAVALRLTGIHPNPVVSLLAFGAAVVAASFVLAWAAEAAQVDVSGGLAIAVLALIAVLPEYAVDLYYAYVAGHNAEYVQYAAANMTGSNRLLMGVGWPVVVIVGLYVAQKMSADQSSKRLLVLEPGNRVELGFLLIAGLVAFIIPATGRIHLVLGVALLAWFGFYLYKLTRGEAEEPDLVGTAAALGALPDRARRIMVAALFLLSGAVILMCAEPFANSLIDAGAELGIDRFLLVQWLAPLASEAPEFIIATIFAARGKSTAAIATLDLVQGQPVDTADGFAAPRVSGRRRRNRVGAGRPADRGSAADGDPDHDGRRADPVAAVPPGRRPGCCWRCSWCSSRSPRPPAGSCCVASTVR
ncbi:hypothetical protein MAUB1S_03876 [Mycolicibacterium aubagnense]